MPSALCLSVSLHFRGSEQNVCRTNRLGGGRCLTLERHREGLAALLIGMSKPVAWPIGPIIRDLTVCWDLNDQERVHETILNMLKGYDILKIYGEFVITPPIPQTLFP
jgi:hypothetical protein